MRRRAAVAATLVLAALSVAGCPKAQAPTPGELAARMREGAPSYDALHAVATAPAKANVLRVREAGLAELPLGATPEQVRARYGEPNHRQQTREGEWWRYDEVLRSAAQQEPGEDGRRPKDIVGTLRLLFKPVAPKTPPDPKAPTMTLVQIRAWAPGAQQTRSLVRLLDPVQRIERKYGPPPRKLSVGWTGGEVWIYPSANVAFVVSPPQPVEDVEGAPEQPPVRVVAGTIVGL